MNLGVGAQFWKLFSLRRKSQLLVLFFLLGLATILENVSVVVLSMFATALLSPQGVTDSWWIPYLMHYFNSRSFDASWTLLATGGLAIAVVSVKNLTGGLAAAWQAAFATHVEMDLGEIMLDNFARVPVAWFHQHSSSNLVLAAQWRQYAFNYISGLLQIVLSLMTCVGLLFILLYSNPFMSLVIGVISCGAAALLYVIFKGKMHRAAEVYVDCCSSVNDLFSCAIQGAREMRVFGASAFFRKEFARYSLLSVVSRRKQYLFTFMPTGFFEVVTLVALVAVTYGMASGVVGSFSHYQLTEGITLLGATVWRLLPSINKLLNALAALKASQPFVEKVLSLIEKLLAACQRQSIGKRVSALRFEHSISFDDASFSYVDSSLPVISHVTFSIRAGQALGIIGRSGAGKTTLVNMLLGLYIPKSGSILIDNSPLTEEMLEGWLKCVGYVPQDPFLRSGTLASNVAYGVDYHEIDLCKVIDCCRKAAIDFVPLTAEGMQTLIGERGVRFSGGQRQRIAIARALYHDPLVLVFDEATSALDAESESRVINTVYSLRKDVTLIMVAHRISTLERCDRVIVIEDGRITMDDLPSAAFDFYSSSLEG